MKPWIEYLFCKIPIVRNAKNEDAICIEFASKLQRMTRQGEFNCVWFHVANEYAGESKPLYGAKLKAMGKVAGVSDYIFMKEGKNLALEFKTTDKQSKQSKGQKCFEQWCKDVGIPYELVRSSQEGFDALKKHGIM
jgi:hypothetical protein